METRLSSRRNDITGTSGLSPGYIQANLLILPSKYSKDFLDLCHRNPVSCPLLAFTSKGDPHTVTPSTCIKNADFDLRTDCPKYRIYEHGKHIDTLTDLLSHWTDDHVGFLIGCSFSFEDALVSAGLQPRHQVTRTVVAMYRTKVPLMPAGIFTGATCVVSMRPYKLQDVERVRDVCRPYLAAHGEPIDWGWSALERLGISSVEKPDFGDAQVFEEGEVPVFWACGVTPQLAVEAAGNKIDGLVFAHEPGHMLVTDFTVEDLESLGRPVYN
ncbi:hypothetical protein BDV25DRAFT_169332 [Aspergillus avenaceus]|uniref:DUF1445 domain protein n=1 Tax=Aspergillus avenaceus TaxID=36643 RepID=A0A5N6U9C3_ASPAV|nr:hypothetical protein BDV25DRAFT_169332 [Aspergillus avenaceus]